MAEYIEREAALKLLNRNSITKHITFADDVSIYDTIKNMPAADVVEVVHASWEWGYQNGQYGIWCTNCGAGWVNSENAEWIAHSHDYCGKCGAKMDAERSF